MAEFGALRLEKTWFTHADRNNSRSSFNRKSIVSFFHPALSYFLMHASIFYPFAKVFTHHKGSVRSAPLAGALSTNHRPKLRENNKDHSWCARQLRRMDHLQVGWVGCVGVHGAPFSTAPQSISGAVACPGEASWGATWGTAPTMPWNTLALCTALFKWHA